MGEHSLHVVVVWILADVADIENDGLFAEVLPPMRRAIHLRPKVARLVHDRIDAVAGVFYNLALLDEDQRRPVVMAVPGHDAAGFDGQFSEAQLAPLDVSRLLAQVDRAERDVGDADRLVIDHLTGIRLDFVGGAFAGERGGRGRERNGNGTCDAESLPDLARRYGKLEHMVVSLINAAPPKAGRLRHQHRANLLLREMPAGC